MIPNITGVHSNSAIMRAAEQALAEQRAWPQHPLPAHDILLARRHAKRAPRVSSLMAKLTSSFDFPVDRDSSHQVDAGNASSASSSDSPSAPCAVPGSDLPSTHQHNMQWQLTRLSDASG